VSRFNLGVSDPDLDRAELDDADLDLLDDLVFEPTAWDLAFSIGVGVDPDADRPALDELADALLMWAPEATLERLTVPALELLWDDELEQAIRDGLGRLVTSDGWERAAADALAEFERDPRAAPVSHEAIRFLAMQLGGFDSPGLCLDCIDDGLAHVEPAARRERARRAAVIACRNAAAPETEVRAALADVASRPPLERLGTVERRAAVRARLGRLGELGRRSMPALATELRALAAEPLPSQAADDDVWKEVCTALLAGVARPRLN
jgi:hypothetical protein